nr:inovirus-type Gp2 protein [uncultured Campylobacter sp.]
MTKKHCGRTAQRRQESLNEYVDGIMQTNSRIDVIRVDLYYRQENRDDVTLESFDNDINHLYTNKRGNTLFKNSKGYIIKMEQGDSGYNHLHAHIVIFMDGQNTREQTTPKTAKRLCDYWNNNITKGKGCSHNCNLGKYKNNGLGRFCYNDKEKIQILKEKVLSYLCKGEQNIVNADGKGFRALRRGVMPKKTNKGRPRKN